MAVRDGPTSAPGAKIAAGQQTVKTDPEQRRPQEAAARGPAQCAQDGERAR
jgi:hypothetical protein